MKEKQRKKRKRAKHRKREIQSSDTTMKKMNGIDKIHDNELHTSTISKFPKFSSFLDKMRARFSGGHFRMINEKLYTCTGDEALNYFQEDPALSVMDFANKMFIILHFKKKEKVEPKKKEIEWPELKPCLYKRR